MSLYNSRPAKDVEFPHLLEYSGKGVLITFLTGHNCGLPYKYHQLYDKYKEQL